MITRLRTGMVLLLVFALVMTSALICVPEAAWAAEPSMRIYGGAVTAKPGETVGLPVYIENNPGISSTIIYVDASASGQNLTAVPPGSGIGVRLDAGRVFASGSILTNVVEEGNLVLWYAASDNTRSGELFTMYFKAADDAVNGTYPVKITYSPADTANVAGKKVPAVTVDGSITITGGKESLILPVVPDQPDSSEDGTASAEDETDTSFIDDVKAAEIKLTSKLTKVKGKRAIKLTWKIKEGSGIEAADLDGFLVHRSTKKSKGYGTKPYFTTKKLTYTNTKSLKKGKSYYFKVRGFVELDGKKYYTKWSNKAWRTVK